MARCTDPDQAAATLEELDVAVLRLASRAHTLLLAGDHGAVRALALDVVAGCDRLSMALEVDAVDGGVDDAFDRFMHGDGERELVAFAR